LLRVGVLGERVILKKLGGRVVVGECEWCCELAVRGFLEDGSLRRSGLPRSSLTSCFGVSFWKARVRACEFSGQCAVVARRTQPRAVSVLRHVDALPRSLLLCEIWDVHPIYARVLSGSKLGFLPYNTPRGSLHNRHAAMMQLHRDTYSKASKARWARRQNGEVKCTKTLMRSIYGRLFLKCKLALEYNVTWQFQLFRGPCRCRKTRAGRPESVDPIRGEQHRPSPALRIPPLPD
jgi:hypothetical protein